MTLQEHRNQLAADRRVAETYATFAAEKSRLRGAMLAAFEKVNSMSEWSVDDDRMLDMMTMWLVSIYERGTPQAPAAARDLKLGETLVPESWRKS